MLDLYIRKLVISPVKISIDCINRSINWTSLWLRTKFIKFRFWKQFTEILSERFFKIWINLI